MNTALSRSVPRLFLVVVVLAGLVGAPAGPASAAALEVIPSDRVVNAPAYEPVVDELTTFTNESSLFVGGGVWQGPALSGDGNWATYPAETANGPRLIRMNVKSGATRVVSGARAGFGPSISADGSHIAFHARDQATSRTQVYLWTAASNSVTKLSSGPGSLSLQTRRPVIISDDGQRVVWSESVNGIYGIVVWTAGSISRFAESRLFELSGNGRYVLYGSVGGWYRRDLATGLTVAAGGFGPMTDDGSLIVESGYYFGPEGNGLGWGGRVTAENGDQLIVPAPGASSTPTARISGDGSRMIMHPGHVVVELGSRSIRNATRPSGAAIAALSDNGRRGLMLERRGSSSYHLWLVDYDREQPPAALTSELSKPQLSDQIRRLYRAVFLRDGSPSDIAYWTRQRASGSSIIDVAGEFVAATEFVNRYGSVADADFVRLIYRNVLDREPDQEGLDFWTGQLSAGMTRAELVVGFSDSNELISRSGTASLSPPGAVQVWRLYRAYFLRSADQDGLDYWFTEYWNGGSLIGVSDAFASSAEFVNRYGSLSNAQFIAQVYRNVLEREPEASGVDFWTAQLAAGTTRGEMMLGFSDSPEFIRRTDTLPPVD